MTTVLHAAGAIRIRLAGMPFTLALVTLLWTIGAATGSLLTGPSRSLLGGVGFGVSALFAGHWYSPLTSWLFCGDLVSYLGSTVLLLGLLGPAERRLGTARVAGLAVLVQLAGALLGIGLISAGAAAGEPWSTQLLRHIAVGPSGAAIGVALAASGGLAPQTRRRLRLLLITATVLMALYAGALPDVLRVSAAVVGFGVGRLFLGAAPAVPVRLFTRPERRILVAIAVAASAVGPVLAALSHAPIGPLAALRFLFLTAPPDAETVRLVCAEPATATGCAGLQLRMRLWGIGPAIMSVLPVLLLLIMADGLRRGRRFAWWGAVLINLLLAGLAAIELAQPATIELLLGHPLNQTRRLLADMLPLTQPLLVVAALIATRTLFAVRAPRGTYRALGRLAALTLAATGAGYVVGGYLLRAQFDPSPDLFALLADLPNRYLPPGYLAGMPPAFLPQRPPAGLLYELTGPVFLLVLAAGLIVTFRRGRLDSDADDAAQLRDLLTAYGGSNLAWLSTWRGNSYWFTDDRQVAIAYRLIGGIALTTGDPIGNPAGRPEAVLGFSRHCAERGWTPCFYNVTDQVCDVVDDLGWHRLQVAEETMLCLPGLRFTGKRWQDVRTALNRAARAGIRAEWITYRTAPAALTDQIDTLSRRWLTDKGLPEMGFTLGGLAELADDQVRCLVAVDADGVLHGMTSWMPIHREGAVIGWTLDMMRRSQDGFAGVMEFLIASAAQLAAAEGAQLLSLSGAPLARQDRGLPSSSLQRLLDLVGRTLEPVYGFRSLLAFKAKFQPTYQPLSMVYPDPAALPAIAAAIGRAYLPQLRGRDAARLLTKLLARDWTLRTA